MIDEKYIAESLQELSDSSLLNKKIGDYKSAYHLALYFAELTGNLIITGETRKAFRCLKLAEQFWKEGNRSVRNAIEQVFLFGLAASIKDKNYIIEQLPPLIKTEFKNRFVLINPSLN